ncbi:MAG: radical SAM family heme chaperone HemW [Gammaproteobacteria bacterium]|jgi:oxygen-independent coproporphyrinogen-3 oxidase|nr:radical SAM family heme chaperone HemW [Gammaproteobacteria bacterium]
MPPLSLYVHFPWCVAKCPYCDFNSHALRGELPAEQYLAALQQDLRSWPAEFRERPLQSVFLGGGTPSLFAPDVLARLLELIARVCSLPADAEITLEANPGALEHGAFAGYVAAGINRLSLGVQSFDDDRLQALGRIHSSADALRAFAAARAAGIDNINLDLMYALPDQPVDGAVADIERALSLAPEHISHYHLTLEPNTVFYSRPPALPSADLAWSMQAACAQRLSAAGFLNYEVSAWAQPERACRHNLNYWRYGDYMAIGAGAHAKVTARDGQVFRSARAAHPREYQRRVAAGVAAGDLQLVATADRPFEFMLNALRLRDGVPLAAYAAYTGLAIESLEPGLSAALQAGLLDPLSSGRLRASDRGWRFLDDLQVLFLPSAAAAAGGP